MMNDLMSIEEIASIYPDQEVKVTILHASLFKRVCDTALAAHHYKAILTDLNKTVFNVQKD